MISLDDIQGAREAIRPHLKKTPCVLSEPLSDQLECRLYFKFENLHRTGSFKERGALNKLLDLADTYKSAGVITASAGNHGQAVAFHATQLGLSSVVVMPEKTPLVKVSSTRRWGAEVVLYGRNYGDALEKAHEIERERGSFFVHGFDDPEIIAGQGTLTVELREEEIPCDVMLLPIGGGGLIAGNALALKALYPKAEIYGIEPENCPSMRDALAAGHPVAVEGLPSLADGLAVKTVGKLPCEIVSREVDGFYLVSEEEIANAILVLLEVEKSVVEGAGAASFAALLNREELRRNVRGKDVVVPLCGGNIDVNLLSKIIDRGLAKDGRLGRFRVVVPDQPGSLTSVTERIARGGGNILDIFHTRALADTQVGEVAIDVVVETRGRDHLEALRKALTEAGIRLEPK